ncbi:MAG: zinc ribbon domain-containing protein, partial [Erysipelotrichaceae bacterium]|nr:zinc ribbon domain-containing protein [Erysipelotrichaceae bacterium]
MFIIWGTAQRNKKLDFNQAVICNHCGQRGLIEVYKHYTAFTLFYIPTFRWGVQYFARMSCCGVTIDLDKETGRAIERGEITQLNSRLFPEGEKMRTCPHCGHEIHDEGNFCPVCGKQL